MYFLDYLKDSSRLEAKNRMYLILMAGKYHKVGYFKYWLWGPFHNAYHARPFFNFNSMRGTIYTLSLGNTECSQVPSDICTGKFDVLDHKHL